MFKEVMFLNHRKIFIIWLCSAVFATVGCITAPKQAAQENVRDFIHPNGLIVKLNEDFSAKEVDNGFIVEPTNVSNENVRFPVEIKISLHEEEEIPANDLMKQKDIANWKIIYQIEKDNDGSGGEMYSFGGYEKVSGGYIKYEQTIQSELSEPDFQTLWKIIENTRLKNNR